ncbi:MAG: riboflavin synthase [Verrucomicrobiota bacterium]
MFTGLVETQGEILQRIDSAGSVRLVLQPLQPLEGIRIGDSIAVNGCCLTVVQIEGQKLTFDLLEETDRRTNFKAVQIGSRVNLERSLRPLDRMGGHYVTGHIDATSRILRWELSGRDYVLEIALNPSFQKWMIPKGSIAIDGISLTVGEVLQDRFQVWIIPHTREVTNLATRNVGDEVNLEFDMIAKYTEKMWIASNSSFSTPPSAVS